MNTIIPTKMRSSTKGMSEYWEYHSSDKMWDVDLLGCRNIGYPISATNAVIGVPEHTMGPLPHSSRQYSQYVPICQHQNNLTFCFIFHSSIFIPIFRHPNNSKFVGRKIYLIFRHPNLHLRFWRENGIPISQILLPQNTNNRRWGVTLH